MCQERSSATGRCPTKYELPRSATSLAMGLLSALALWTCSTARAQAPEVDANSAPATIDRALGEADPFTGSFSQSIPIVVPPFHGIEPKLALTYNSAAGNDIAGVGVRLAGYARIVRAAPGFGTPRFDSSDVFYLDGQELVLCKAGSVSPSCTNPDGSASGAYYSTKIESYLRIKFDSSANEWSVWTRDGIRTTLSVPYYIAKPVVWTVSKVSDLHGNVVQYGTRRPAFLPDQITYNGTTITFTYENRPDAIPPQGGLAAESIWMDQRLKSIEVRVGATLQRAYVLTYVTSGYTGRSLLKSVQQFGTDAAFDRTALGRPGGTYITGGTSLPPITFSWPTEGPSGTPFRFAPYNREILNGSAGDFNGDGKTDIFYENSIALNSEELCYSWLQNVDGFQCLGSTLVTTMSAAHYSLQLSNGDGTFKDVGVPVPNEFYPPAGVVDAILGDFNGDGKTDFLLRETRFPVPMLGDFITHRWVSVPETPVWTSIPVFLSNGDGTFTVTIAPLPSSATKFFHGEDFEVTTGDFDGDGKTDLLVRDLKTLQLRMPILFSNGDGTFRCPVAILPESHFNAMPQLSIIAADFDGDGKTDVAAVWNGPVPWNYFPVYFSNGDGSFRLTKIPLEHDYTPDHIAMVGDFDGDGKSDFAVRVPGSSSLPVYFSNGDGSFRMTNLDLPSGVAWNKTQNPIIDIGDFNGDGRSDIAAFDDGANQRLYRSQGDGSFSLITLRKEGWPSHHLSGDFDGDGKSDLAFGEHGLSDIMLVTPASENGYGERVHQVENGIGGVVTIEYTPSSHFSSSGYSPLTHVVTTLGVSDGVGNLSHTKYSYSGALYDPEARRFLGFRYVKTTLPCANDEEQCPYTETWYRQDKGSVSKPESKNYRRGDGVAIRWTLHHYETNGSTVPYTSHETSTLDYLYNEDGSLQRLLGVSRHFDSYGNIDVETSHGDLYAASDEYTLVTRFYPNTSQYISALPAAIARYKGTDSSGKYLGSIQFIYDSASSPTVQPTKGDLTRVDRWVDTYESWLSNSYTYDTYGNRTHSTDALGYSTITTYDTIYHIIPATVTDKLGHTTTFTPDARCFGLPSQSIDPNGAVTYAYYDPMCRATDRFAPLGAWETTSYCGSSSNPCGTIGQQYTEILSPSADNNGPQWARQYYDGLGRVIFTAQKGPNNDAIVTLTTYNARGKAASTTRPFSAPSIGPAPFFEAFQNPARIPATELYVYDALDRLTLLMRSDGATVRKTYQVGKVTTTDVLKRTVDEFTDSLGHLTSRIEYHDGSPLETKFTYDDYGYQDGITDPAGNHWSFLHDSLGRLIYLDDPDRGRWSFYYDSRSQLQVQVDGKNQKTRFYYDAGGRLTQRTTSSGTPRANTVSWAYDQRASASCSMNGGCAHHICEEGSTLNSTCSPCVAQICSIDPTCCQVYWDSTCADQVQSVCHQSCEAQPKVQCGNCSHELCSAGAQLDSTCDGCVSRICAVDPFCCSTAWDDICVSEVNSVCHQSCTNVGRLTSSTDQSGSTALNYDALGRLIGKQRSVQCGSSPCPGSPYAFAYGYDEGGRLRWKQFPDGDAIGSESDPITYDGAGRMQTIPGIARAEYRPNGSPSLLQFSNSTKTVFTPDSLDRLRHIQSSSSSGGKSVIIQDTDYGLDPLGRATTETSFTDVAVPWEQSEAWSFHYDDLDRLDGASESSSGYALTCHYDALGNMTNNSGLGDYTYPKPGERRPHAVSNIGNTAYSYDDNGDMTQSGSLTIQYDGARRATNIGDASMEYDADGRRIKKVAGSTTTVYPEDGYEVANGVATKYISLGGRVVAMREGSATRWLHTDRLGSVRYVTDPTGTVIGARRYYPFGDQRAATGPVASIGYTAEHQDESGQIYLNARYFDPRIGRFTSPDPILSTRRLVGLNAYAYAFNDPINRMDPSGMDPTYGPGEGPDAEPIEFNWTDPMEWEVGTITVTDAEPDGAGLSQPSDASSIYVNQKSEVSWSAGSAQQASEVRASLGMPAAGDSMTLGEVQQMPLEAQAAFYRLEGFPEAYRAADLSANLNAAYGQAEGIDVVAPALSESAKTFDAALFATGLLVSTVGAVKRAVDASTIRFSQDSIGRVFKDGGTLRNTIAGLKSGAISPESFPPIRVLERGGQLFTLDNRRLFVFQKAGIPIRIVPATAEEIVAEAWKFTTTNGGISITVRGGL
jgi:RHS repeat-associated protein